MLGKHRICALECQKYGLIKLQYNAHSKISNCEKNDATKLLFLIYFCSILSRRKKVSG